MFLKICGAILGSRAEMSQQLSWCRFDTEPDEGEAVLISYSNTTIEFVVADFDELQRRIFAEFSLSYTPRSYMLKYKHSNILREIAGNSSLQKYWKVCQMYGDTITVFLSLLPPPSRHSSTTAVNNPSQPHFSPNPFQSTINPQQNVAFSQPSPFAALHNHNVPIFSVSSSGVKRLESSHLPASNEVESDYSSGSEEEEEEEVSIHQNMQKYRPGSPPCK